MTPAEVLARQQASAKREALELSMLQQLRAIGADVGMQRQFRFHPVRQWRADFAWPAQMLMLEVDGGTFTQGRHTRGMGFEKDCHKRAAAVLAGWRVLHVTGALIKSGVAAQWVEQALKGVPACSA